MCRSTAAVLFDTGDSWSALSALSTTANSDDNDDADLTPPHVPTPDVCRTVFFFNISEHADGVRRGTPWPI